jgi:hypothetical protein
VQDFVATVEEVIPVLQPGIYPAYFSGIKEQTNDTGTFWLLTFSATDGDNQVEITATTSPRITPKTKMGKWLAALIGRPLEVGEPVNFTELAGAPCQIMVVINDAGYSRIEQVLPPPRVK